eukprot:TRINITY_DN511_c0_g13_i1.p1 TRINITY_DN511_c0_g13~~TRINITY_DN511_c0_g13_i1.p1  ORF type:complete len:719 (+),score=193.31 TRINITY_DN511_c0_g13_i1:111-2267(+)
MSMHDVRKGKKKSKKQKEIVPIIHLEKAPFVPKRAADETLGHRDSLFPVLSARSPRSRIHSRGISTFTARQNASMQKTVKKLFLRAPSETAGMKQLSLSRSLPPALRRGEHEITMSKEYFENGLKKAVRRLEEYELVPDREQYLLDIEQLRERTQLLRTPDIMEHTPPHSAGKDSPRTPLISKRQQMLQRTKSSHVLRVSKKMEGQEKKHHRNGDSTKSVHTMSLERMIQSTTDQAYIRTRMIEHIEMDNDDGDGTSRKDEKLADHSKVMFRGLRKQRKEGETDFLDKNKESAHKKEKEIEHRELQLVNEREKQVKAKKKWKKLMKLQEKLARRMVRKLSLKTDEACHRREIEHKRHTTSFRKRLRTLAVMTVHARIASYLIQELRHVRQLRRVVHRAARKIALFFRKSKDRGRIRAIKLKSFLYFSIMRRVVMKNRAVSVILYVLRERRRAIQFSNIVRSFRKKVVMIQRGYRQYRKRVESLTVTTLFQLQFLQSQLRSLIPRCNGFHSAFENARKHALQLPNAYVIVDALRVLAHHVAVRRLQCPRSPEDAKNEKWKGVDEKMVTLFGQEKVLWELLDIKSDTILGLWRRSQLETQIQNALLKSSFAHSMEQLSDYQILEHLPMIPLDLLRLVSIAHVDDLRHTMKKRIHAYSSRQLSKKQEFHRGLIRQKTFGHAAPVWVHEPPPSWNHISSVDVIGQLFERACIMWKQRIAFDR